MAEEGSSPSGNSDGRNFSTVVSLLRQAELLLSSQVDRNAATVRPSNVETSANYISTDRSLANFRSLFARYSVPPSSPAASLGQARASSAPPPKRKKDCGTQLCAHPVGCVSGWFV